MSVKSDEAKWQAQDDVRTLERAEEIKLSSSRLKAAAAEAKRQLEALQKVTKKVAPKAAKPRSRPKAAGRAKSGTRATPKSRARKR